MGQGPGKGWTVGIFRALPVRPCGAKGLASLNPTGLPSSSSETPRSHPHRTSVRNVSFRSIFTGRLFP